VAEKKENQEFCTLPKFLILFFCHSARAIAAHAIA
jgi:hypothetical protein